MAKQTERIREIMTAVKTEAGSGARPRRSPLDPEGSAKPIPNGENP